MLRDLELSRLESLKGASTSKKRRAPQKMAGLVPSENIHRNFNRLPRHFLQ